MERIENVPVPSKLPLEIMGLILMQVDEDDPIEELKKCRLISSRYYKAVQDLFQDEFAQKLCTHFDGSKYNFTKSRTFGMNIFGSYKLNFDTVKISRAEFYLMKSWLEKLISTTNLQTLELKDNQLDWKEIILVLKKFSSIVNLKFIQTSKDMELAKEILKLFLIKSKPNTGGYQDRVKEQFAKEEVFLPNLKNFEAQIVHIGILNILSFIISRAHCKLESVSIKIDIKKFAWYAKKMDKSHFTSLKIKFLDHFKKFSKWLKTLEIGVSSHGSVDYDYVVELSLFKSILQIFSKPNKLTMFTSIENLKIKMPKLYYFNKFNEKQEIGLFEFIKNQKNLQKIDIDSTISTISEPLVQGYILRKLDYVLKNFMITPMSTFGFKVYNGGPEPILGFAENLSKLHITVYNWENWNNSHINWRFSDRRIPVFPNCKTLFISTDVLDGVNGFEVGEMIQKFPNLLKLSLDGTNFEEEEEGETRPLITNNDLKLIISHYKELKSLYLGNVCGEFEEYDSALTGLSLEAIEARKLNPGLPITSEDRIGHPISSLKDLESLCIESYYFEIRITDLSAHHAFDKMMKMKFLDISSTMITRNGFETIREKMKSKNLVVDFTYDDYDDSDA